MFALKAVCVIVILVQVLGHNIRVSNRCQQTVDVGVLNNPGKSLPSNGGFRLNQGQSRMFTVAKGWAGRIWGRTGCEANGGKCQTGDCGDDIDCQGRAGRAPATIAEMTFDAATGIDYYDISFANGYNLPMTMKPFQSYDRKGGKFDCGVAGCRKNLNENCPNELRMRVGGKTVACKSACGAYNTDQYCCRGAYDHPDTCKPSKWPKNYPKYFKDNCPGAYSYAFDDKKSTFTCQGEHTGYNVTFCG